MGVASVACSLSRASRALLEKHSHLRVVITPPRSAPYEAITFGPSTRPVGIRLVNEGKNPVDIAGLGAVFTATRSVVEFQCKTRHHETVQEHEPSWLSPGESYSFDRDINGLMPLPGRYEIGVYLTFDETSAVASGLRFNSAALSCFRAPRDRSGHFDALDEVIGRACFD